MLVRPNKDRQRERESGCRAKIARVGRSGNPYGNGSRPRASPVNGSRGYLRRGDTPRILFDKTLERQIRGGGGGGCDGTRDYGNPRCPASKGSLVFGFQRADRYHLFLARGGRVEDELSKR